MANIMISERELAKIESHVASQKNTIEKLRGSHAGATGLNIAEAAGAAALTGFMRGHFERTGKTFALGPVDIELLLGAALVGASFIKKGGLGKYRTDVSMMGMGILSHYAGQMGRAIGKTQQMPTSTVIGMLPDHVGMGPVFNSKFVGADLGAALRHAAG